MHILCLFEILGILFYTDGFIYLSVLKLLSPVYFLPSVLLYNCISGIT